MAEPAPPSPEADRSEPKVGRWEPPKPGPGEVEGPKDEKIREIGGRKDGPDPTRYGDWEKNGRCIDF